MGRMMPVECPHGTVIDYGDFGPCQDCLQHDEGDCPNLVDCPKCDHQVAAPSHPRRDVEQHSGAGSAGGVEPAPDDRSEWLDWRRKGIGASDVAGIVGVSPWSSPFSVWADKAGLTDDAEPSDAMRMGLLVEPLLGELFTERTGLQVTAVQQRCEHPSKRWMRCTLDGMAVDAGASLGPVEMKWTADTAASWADEIPTHYRIQAAWQCAITGHESMWFAVIHVAFGRPQFEVYEFTPDPDDIEWLIGKAEAFWTAHVVTGVPPEGDGSRATADAIADVWGANPDPSGEIAADDDVGLLHTLMAYKAAQTDRKNAEAREAECKNKLRIRMGDAEVVTVGGKPAASWKPQTRRSVDTERLKDEHRDVFDACQKESTFRVLRTHKNGGVKHG